MFLIIVIILIAITRNKMSYIGLIAPPGWINPTTPGSATVYCGHIIQTAEITTTGATPEAIPFSISASWSNNSSWTSDDGITWVCQVAGIYSVNVSQQLTVTNGADIVNPVVNVNLTVTSQITTEFNKKLQSSMLCPVTTTNAVTMGLNLSGIICVGVGDTMQVTVESPSGDIEIVSGGGGVEAPEAALSYSLIAQGDYGNVGVLV